jgi:hypothetical protein
MVKLGTAAPITTVSLHDLIKRQRQRGLIAGAFGQASLLAFAGIFWGGQWRAFQSGGQWPPPSLGNLYFVKDMVAQDQQYGTHAAAQERDQRQEAGNKRLIVMMLRADGEQVASRRVGDEQQGSARLADRPSASGHVFPIHRDLNTKTR